MSSSHAPPSLTHYDALVQRLGALLGPMASWPGVHTPATLAPALARKLRAHAQCAGERIVLAYVPAHTETALVLLTDAALYLDDPFLRLEHAKLRWEAQPGPPPAFVLPDGALTLGPRFRSDQPAVMLLGTAWNAVVQCNAAVGPPTPAPFEVRGALAEHARATLYHPKIRVGPRNLACDGLIYDAVAAVGVGVDPFAEEVPLAVAADPAKLDEVVLLTDQRLVAKTSKGPLLVPYSALRSVAPGGAGMLAQSLALHLHGGVEVLRLEALYDLAPTLGRFLYDVSALPLEARRAAPEPFAPEPDDATWARAARATGAGRDPQLAVVFRAVERAHERGALDAEVGRDLVRRARLLYRMQEHARGMHRGLWLSALAPRDLALLCGKVLGPTSSVTTDATGALVGEFTLREGGVTGRDVGAAAVSSAVGLTVGLVFGIGWVSVPRGPTVTRVRAVLHAAPWGSAFALYTDGPGGLAPLPMVSPALFARVDEALARGEQQLLFLRALYGWHPEPAALLGLPADAVRARVAELTGDAGLLDAFRGGA